MKHSYLLAAVAAGLLSVASAGPAQARVQNDQDQSSASCTELIQTVESHVMTMKSTRLKAKAKKELAAARAAADKQDDMLCLKHVARANHEVVREHHAMHPSDSD